eukprot:gnl/MRDRNA2_/MRDRNA2_142181_c0_seq1.p1 gnl/MRDRNA2_/MRDRNA2_142181_c0~~gnl/MRDRNA2_/MRDRNA2_142181_c0_seq1.p1  ORF type:complete len:394 (+),score=34.10 gnl/MRDRNA2_/MRDRNA2_142181_c0_seq1:154-1182(+)
MTELCRFPGIEKWFQEKAGCNCTSGRVDAGVVDTDGRTVLSEASNILLDLFLFESVFFPIACWQHQTQLLFEWTRGGIAQLLDSQNLPQQWPRKYLLYLQRALLLARHLPTLYGDTPQLFNNNFAGRSKHMLRGIVVDATDIKSIPPENSGCYSRQSFRSFTPRKPESWSLAPRTVAVRRVLNLYGYVDKFKHPSLYEEPEDNGRNGSDIRKVNNLANVFFIARNPLYDQSKMDCDENREKSCNDNLLGLSLERLAFGAECMEEEFLLFFGISYVAKPQGEQVDTREKGGPNTASIEDLRDLCEKRAPESHVMLDLDIRPHPSLLELHGKLRWIQQGGAARL